MEKAQAALKGVMMELEDCAFPLLAGMVGTDDPKVAFKDVDYALLVGARPRGPGMERKDLLLENAKIFTAQGKALNDVATRNVKVLVVGNPANTNAYIAMKSAPDLDREEFHRDAAPGPQPRAVAAGREDRHGRRRHQEDDRVGQPLPDHVSGLPLRDVKRRVAEGQSTTRTGTRTRSSRRSASAAPRSSRRAGCRRLRRPPTRRSTTCATGRSAPAASGSRWACRRTAATASPGRDVRLPGDLRRTASTRSCRACEIDEFSRERWTRRWRSWRKSAPAWRSLLG